LGHGLPVEGSAAKKRERYGCESKDLTNEKKYLQE